MTIKQMKLTQFIQTTFYTMFFITALNANKNIEMGSKEFYEQPPTHQIQETTEAIEVKFKKTETHDILENYVLKIRTSPANASIKFKGSNRKYTWAMKVKKGKYTLIISKKNYYSKEIKINLDKDTYKSIELKRKTYTLKITPNISNAKIQIVNIGPKYKNNIRLNANINYEIMVSKKGYHSKLFKVYLDKDRDLKVSLKKRKIKPKYHTLKIIPLYRGKWTNAKIRIPNIMAKYKANIKLASGYYIISVKKRGCKERRFTTHLTHNKTIPVKLCK